VSGDWEAPENWLDNVVPTSSDNVLIDKPGVTVTINSHVTIQGLDSTASIDIAGGSLTVQADSEINGDLTITAGQTLIAEGAAVLLTVNGATSIDGASIFARSGATLSLPAATTYAAPQKFNTESFFRAEGAGSVLALPNLTAITSSTQSFTYLNVEALAGGQVDLAGLDSITGPAGGTSNQRGIRVLADGVGSMIDLASLSSFTNSAARPDSSLAALNGGTIINPGLTELVGVDLSIDGTGNLSTSQITTLQRGKVTINGGATADLSNAASIDGASFFVRDGATLSLPAATTYAAPQKFNVESFFRAEGAGSVLALPNLTAITGSTQSFTYLNVEALAGGQVDLAGLGTITGPAGGTSNQRGIHVLADGAGSMIDIASLSSFTNSAARPDSSLAARNSGIIISPVLTTLEGVDVAIDGTGIVSTSQVTTLLRGTVTISGGATVDLSNAASIDGASFFVRDGASVDLSNSASIDFASFFVRDGATLSLPSATSYAVPQQFSFESFFQAEDPGSVLALPNLITIKGSTQAFTYLNIEALDGGRVDLAGLGSITGPAGGSTNVRGVRVLADGVGSTIDLTSLTGFTNSAAGPDSRLAALNGGTIINPVLTELVGVDLPIDETGTVSTSQITTLHLGEVTISGGATADLSNAASIDGASFFVRDGATLSIPAATSYALPQVFSVESVFRAEDAGSVLSLPNLTAITGSSQAFTYLNIEALAGGRVDLAGLGTITGPAGGTTNRRGVHVLADDAGSTIDLTSLTSFTNSPQCRTPAWWRSMAAPLNSWPREQRASAGSK